MTVVARGNDHRIHPWICKQGCRIARGDTKAKLASIVSGAYPTGAGDPQQLRPGARKRRNEHPACVISRSDDGDRRLLCATLWLADVELEGTHGDALSRRSRIFQQYAQIGLGPRNQQLVRCGHVCYREAMSNERRDVQRAHRQHVENRLEVALLGPAYESDRIIRPLFLVCGVIAAGSVRARYLEAELLHVEIRPLQLQACDAHEYDAAALATHTRRLRDRFVAVGRRGYQHTVDAPAPRESLGRRRRVLPPVELDGVGTK